MIGEVSQAGPGKSDALQLDVSFAAVGAMPSAGIGTTLVGNVVVLCILLISNWNEMMIKYIDAF